MKITHYLKHFSVIFATNTRYDVKPVIKSHCLLNVIRSHNAPGKYSEFDWIMLNVLCRLKPVRYHEKYEKPKKNPQR